MALHFCAVEQAAERSITLPEVIHPHRRINEHECRYCEASVGVAGLTECLVRCHRGQPNVERFPGRSKPLAPLGLPPFFLQSR